MGVAARPLVVGIVHGLAGSGALTALALGSAPSLGVGVAVAAFFGIGSMLAMAIVTGILGASVARVAGKARVSTGLLVAAGVTSVLLGVAWGSGAIARLVGA
jgi:hypothetical protein